ncbi:MULTISPECIES: isoprenyl transferase [Vagococcus]|uniref:Isoprenyl transferase n=1 Tax=Vagococcus fluvialis bH819 TaxID=1255619 RepID=A0A1X6WQU9_9ENTE|nr:MULTISPECIES: isoprenyl transferase [Vagococcus]SLM86713.1 Undecaprenyl diphosphate synthase [Vagococcus fluvialis bH819]HCM90921.1 isoprenyl transferase [Vagococcus sp.]
MFNFFVKDKKEKCDNVSFDETKDIPKHIAVIMDGNGRWAQRKLLPRIAGHKEGMNNVKVITKHASRLGVKVLTLYAFSTENWKRPTDEVNFLMKLPVDFFDVFVPELIKENVRVNVMGYKEFLPEHTQRAVENAINQTKDNTGMILNFALNYGSRAEILTAVNELVDLAKEGSITDEVDEELFSSHLMTASLGKELQNPDLLIRTSGEERISNFLLWQIAYSELFFSDVYWPDFSTDHLEEAIATFQLRTRRFGGLKEKTEGVK